MKLPKMIAGDFDPHFSLKHMLKDMQIASRFGLSHHLELAVSAAVRDRLLEQEQRGHAEEDYSVVARKYFPEVLPAVNEEVNLELFEKPPPVEPAATISSMGEVAAAVPPPDVVQSSQQPPAAQETPKQPEPEPPLTNVIAPVSFVPEEQETAKVEPAPSGESQPARETEQAIASAENLPAPAAPEESLEEPERRGLFNRLLRRDSSS